MTDTKLTDLTSGTFPDYFYGTQSGNSRKFNALPWYNIKNYGAVADGTSHKVNERYATLGAAQAVWPCVTDIANDEIDWAATQTAITEMFGHTNGGTVYAPRGSYFLGSNQVSLATSSTKGRFVGDGAYSTTFSGTYNSGFLIEAPYQYSSVTEISGMRIVNFSSKIGTGALRYVQNNEPGFITNLRLDGMTGLDAGWNVFNLTAIGITTAGNGQGVVSPYGSVGILLSGTNLFGHRNVGAAHEIAVTMVGSQSMTVSGISVEESPVGVVLGLYIGFGTATITGANGSKKLTVSGTLYPPAASTATPLIVGDQIVTSGVDPTTNPAIVITAQDSGTSQEQGVYSLSGADNVTINSAQPIQIRRRWIVSGFHVSNFETEGNVVGLYILNASAGLISGMNITGQINQGVTNQYGGALVSSSNLCSPMAGIYIEGGSGIKITGSGISANTTKAAIEFSPSTANYNQFVLDGVRGTAATGGTSDANAFIDNGAGASYATTTGSGTTLNFTPGALSGSIAAGCVVYDTTHSGGLSQYTRVVTVNSGTGVVTINQAITGSFVNGDTIKFCIPSGVAGNKMTVQTINTTLGRGTTCFAPGLFYNAPQGGFAVQGTGIGTGSDTPMVSDQINGYGDIGAGNGGQSYAQYTLIKADGSAVSLNVGPEVLTFVGGKVFGVSNLTGLSGISATQKAGITLNPVTSNLDTTIDMLFADLPAQSGVGISTAILGMEYIITDGAKSGGGTAAAGDTVQGGASQKLKVCYSGSAWKCVAALT